MVSKQKSNTIAVLGTVLFMILLFLLLWFLTLTWKSEPEEEGIEIAFGTEQEGGGSQPIESEAVPLPEPEASAAAPQAPSSNDLMVQEDESALALAKQRDEEEKARQRAEAERLQREREAQAKAEAERLAREKALAEKQAKEQAAIAKANQLGSLFGNNGANAQGSGDTQGSGQKGNPLAGHGSSGNSSWSLAGRSCKSLPKPSDDFAQEGTVVVAIIVDANGKVVSAKQTTGTTISNDATIQLAIKAAYKAEFNFTDRPDKQFGTITYHFKFK